MRTFTSSRNLFYLFLFLSFSLSFFSIRPISLAFSDIVAPRLYFFLSSLSPPHLVRILLSTNSGCSKQSCTCLEDSQNYSRYHVRCNHVTQLPTKRFCSFSVFLVPRHHGGEGRVELLALVPQEINFFVSLSDRPLTFLYIFSMKKRK